MHLRIRPAQVLVLCQQSYWHLGCVKASGFNDRKASCIELIQRALRSQNRVSFHFDLDVQFLTGIGIITFFAADLLVGDIAFAPSRLY